MGFHNIGNNLSTNAFEFFSNLILTNEKGRRIGTIFFENDSNSLTRTIEIKALNQNERALLQCAITDKIPEGFSEKDLQSALTHLKSKVLDSRYREYKHSYKKSKKQSTIKKVKHAFQKNVIKTEDLYKALSEKELEKILEKFESEWNEFENEVEKFADPGELKVIKKHFISLIKTYTRPQGQIAESKLLLKEIHEEIKNAFQNGYSKSSPEITSLINELTVVFLYDQQIKDFFIETASKAADQMKQESARPKPQKKLPPPPPPAKPVSSSKTNDKEQAYQPLNRLKQVIMKYGEKIHHADEFSEKECAEQVRFICGIDDVRERKKIFNKISRSLHPDKLGPEPEKWKVGAIELWNRLWERAADWERTK